MFEIPFRMESSLFKPNWWSLILFIIIFDVIKRPTKNFPSSIFSHRKCSNETHWKPISNATIKTNHQITWVQIINLIDSSRAIHYNPIYIWCQYEVESKIVNEIEKKKKIQNYPSISMPGIYHNSQLQQQQQQQHIQLCCVLCDEKYEKHRIITN